MTGRAAVSAPKTALVLAAGQGTRIRGAAEGRPKPLIPILGRSSLERHLLSLELAGVRDVWINLHFAGNQIVSAIGDGSAFGLTVHYVWEPALRGTAGTFKALGSDLGGGPLLVVYADNVLRMDFQALAATHRRHSGIATIAVFDQDHVPNSGIAGGRVRLDGHGRVSAFVEGGGAQDRLVNAGLYLIEPRLLDFIPDVPQPDFGRDVFPRLLDAAETIAGHQLGSRDYCFGIDTPAALARTLTLLPALEGTSMASAG